MPHSEMSKLLKMKAALSIDGGGGGVEWGGGWPSTTWNCRVHSLPLPAAPTWLVAGATQAGGVPYQTRSRAGGASKHHQPLTPALNLNFRLSCMWLTAYVHMSTGQNVISWGEERTWSFNSCANTQVHFHPVLSFILNILQIYPDSSSICSNDISSNNSAGMTSEWNNL